MNPREENIKCFTRKALRRLSSGATDTGGGCRQCCKSFKNYREGKPMRKAGDRVDDEWETGTCKSAAQGLTGSRTSNLSVGVEARHSGRDEHWRRLIHPDPRSKVLLPMRPRWSQCDRASLPLILGKYQQSILGQPNSTSLPASPQIQAASTRLTGLSASEGKRGIGGLRQGRKSN